MLGWGFWQDHVYASSIHLDVVFCCEGAVHLVFRVVLFCFTEGIVLYIAVDLVCAWQKVSSGSSYAAILYYLPRNVS